jgi:GTPase SAR1 family protein
LAEEKKIVKISIIGSNSVGKKTLFCQYLFGRLPSSADKKLDNEKKTIDIDSNSVILNILEMGSMCVTEDLLDPLIYFADAVILMYSVVDKKSFNIMPLLIAKILNQKKSNRFPIAVVANKMDVLEREISQKQGCGLAERFGVSYFEMSAKNGQNIDAPFVALATNVLNARRNSSDQQDKMKKNSSSSLLA